MCKKILITLLTALLPAAAIADGIAPSEWKISAALGKGFLENPLAEHADGESFFLPSISYYGDRFFLTNLTAGYSLLEEKHFYLDLVARPNEDGLYYKLDSDAVAAGSISSFMVHRSGPNMADIDRDVSVVAGPSATLVTDFVDISFSWFHDVTGIHNGSETHLSLDKQYPLFGGAIGFGIGATQKDADLVDYYYHFTDEEAGFFAPRYARLYPPDDVTDQHARLLFSYPLGKGIELRLSARYNRFDLDGRNPRFIEKPETLSWFAGLQYTIGNKR